MTSVPVLCQLLTNMKNFCNHRQHLLSVELITAACFTNALVKPCSTYAASLTEYKGAILFIAFYCLLQLNDTARLKCKAMVSSVQACTVTGTQGSEERTYFFPPFTLRSACQYFSEE